MPRSIARPIAAFFALAAVAALSQAQAGASQEIAIDKVRVNYSDLNLQTSAGAERLVTRISAAAKQACGGRPAIGVLYRVVRARFDSCVDNAEQAAVSSVSAQRVTAAYMLKQTDITERLATR